MTGGRKRNIVLIVVATIAVLFSVTGFQWIRNNTALLTDKIPAEEMVKNNLNPGAEPIFELFDNFIDDKIIHLPQGFSVSVFASDITSARFMAVNDANTVFVGTKDNDTIYALQDFDNDGVSDATHVIDAGLNKPHSVYYFEGDLYLGEENQVSVYRDIKDDGSYTARTVLVDDLPDGNRLAGGGHTTRTVVVGPDRKLYVSIGSSCNVCEETDNRRATIVRYNLDGTGEEIYATGLRNTVGFLFDEQDLIGVDMGRDQIGDDIPPEEINLIEAGKDYGWPYCYGDANFNPEFPEKEQYCKGETEAPFLTMQAHSAPLGIAKLNDAARINWPEQYARGYFIALHGSWNRTIPTGYKVVFIDTSGAEPKQYNFMTGWLEENANVWGRPVDIVFDSTGGVYVSDDKAGVIYKVTYSAEQ